MFSKYSLTLILTFSSFGFISCFSVNINLSPKVIFAGDYLDVTCIISGSDIDKELKTILICPFYNDNNKNEKYCISNCDSLDNIVANQTFQCIRKESLTTLTTSYHFSSISNDLIKDRRTLQFGCYYKGIIIRENVTILPSRPSYTSPKLSQTTTLSNQVINFSKEHNDIIKQGFYSFSMFYTIDHLRPKDFIYIGVIGTLILSFLINIWCSVQWCIRCSKHRKVKKKKETTNDNSEASPLNNHKKGRSHQTLINDDWENTPVKLNSNNSYHSSAVSLNQRQKHIQSREFEGNNEPQINIMNDQYHHVLVTPFLYQNMSYNNYLPYSSNTHGTGLRINSDLNRSDNNFLENNYEPVKLLSQNTSKIPDDILSVKDSVFEL